MLCPHGVGNLFAYDICIRSLDIHLEAIRAPFLALSFRIHGSSQRDLTIDELR